jgi:dTDP-glucose 4,6-dehydratase
MEYERFAVIGSNSFAGACLVARLIGDNKKVIGFNRSPESSKIFLPYKNISSNGSYQFICADLNNSLQLICDALDDFQPDVVIDFAGQGMVAESWLTPEQWYQTNIVSKVRLHNFLRQTKWLKRYVRISTPEVYGSHDELMRESWQFNPSTPYAVSHAAIDMSLRAFYNQYKFPVIFTRFANFYGPGQQLYRIVPRTIINALLGKKLQLHGGGKSIRAFIHGSDVADGIIKAASLGTIGGVYHFSSQSFYSIEEVVRLICNRLGVDFSLVVEIAADRPAKDMAYLMDSTKARKELGWGDRYSLECGIDETINWIERSLDEIRDLQLDYIHKI